MKLIPPLLLMACLVFLPGIRVGAAEPSPRIVAFEMPGLADTSRIRPYDRILQRAGEQAGIPVRFEYMPPERAKQLFLRGRVGCYFPFDPALFAEVDEASLLMSHTFNLAKSYVFSRKGERTFSRLEDTAGLRIGARYGLTYGAHYERIKQDPAWQIERVQEDRVNFRKLATGRLDVMLAYLPDLFADFNETMLAQLDYQREHPLTVHRDAIACHPNPANRQFMTAFNQGMKQLETSGELRRLLGPLYIAP
ncbi:ABC transporter substrate-binding protein [Chitinimonas sp. BJYL2]|uniref:substrate-binding periplasmic protein n=1 Tax=Chitinimonas sp. BJYL2 TaxID=2976696 RepID=UPI0022B5DF35|nr:transporter substrate-binding domain-containing protein [Chitinimonas sp. BJYL2]